MLFLSLIFTCFLRDFFYCIRFHKYRLTFHHVNIEWKLHHCLDSEKQTVESQHSLTISPSSRFLTFFFYKIHLPKMLCRITILETPRRGDIFLMPPKRSRGRIDWHIQTSYCTIELWSQCITQRLWALESLCKVDILRVDTRFKGEMSRNLSSLICWKYLKPMMTGIFFFWSGNKRKSKHIWK